MNYWGTLARLFCLALVIGSAPLISFASRIVGPWYMTNAGQAQSTVVVAFLADGRYVELEDGDSILDPNGQDGLEKGYYGWDSTTGAFSINTIINTNGEWGFSSLPPGSTVSATSSALTLETSEGSFSIDRLVDPASPIVGAWYLSTSPAAQDLTMVAFLPNGVVMVGIDPPGIGYIEFGVYTFNPSTGALTVTINNSNAPLGMSLNLPMFTNASIVNQSLVLTSNLGNITLVNTAAVPEPGTIGFVLMGLGVLLGRRRFRGALALQ